MTLARHFLIPLQRWLGWCLTTFVLLQLFFVLRVALMAYLDPGTTAFERSEIFRLLGSQKTLHWSQTWRPYNAMATSLKRAVIASEDDGFVQHGGVDWTALQKAWEKNEKSSQHGTANHPPKVVGGSTISQQLAKNLFFSGERNLWRKSEEFWVTCWLELFLSKERILTLYLNHVEWGEGVFGAEAAARHYFRKSAADLNPQEAARLAVMLPRPKYFEKRPDSAYLAQRSATIVERMPSARLP
jgi:monofunctional biosynthetic peptidoglycan transglycosylase